MIEREHELVHSLLPLSLAVSLVQSRLSSDRSAVAPDANGIAMFIAAAVPIWEYPEDARRPPRALRNAAAAGVFRNGGRELRFLDGSPSKFRLAIQADNVGRVVEMLQQPDHALLLRNRALRALARKLVQLSCEARADSGALWSAAKKTFDGAVARKTKPAKKASSR